MHPEKMPIIFIAPLLLLCVLSFRYLTREHMISLLPWRRVKLSEAELEITTYPWRGDREALFVQLKEGERTVYCPVHMCVPTEREELLARLKSVCKSCTERRESGVPREAKRLTLIRLPLVISIALLFVYLVDYVPVTDVVAQTAEVGIANERRCAQMWHKADEAEMVADELLRGAVTLEAGAGLVRMLGLAVAWYSHAAELGNERAATMLLCLRTQSFPGKGVSAGPGGLMMPIPAEERLADALLRMAAEEPQSDALYTKEQLNTALELSAEWYHRVSSEYAHMMLAYLDTMGVPMKDPEAVRQEAEQDFDRLADKDEKELSAQELKALYICYRYGICTEKNEQKADELLHAIRDLRRNVPKPQPPLTTPEEE